MPENATQRLTGRTPVASTRVAPKLDVVARATDPYEAQGLEDQDVVRALASINPALNAYGQIQEAQRADNVAQARADQLNGVKDDNISFLNMKAGYDEAWDELKGKRYAAEEYQPALNLFFAENSHLSPQEFQKKLHDEVTTPFMRQLGSPHQIAGFYPEALALSKAAATANQQKWVATKQLERDTDINASIRIDIQGAIQKDLGLHDESQLLDPKWYKGFQQSKDNPFQEGGKTQAETLGESLYAMYRSGLVNAHALGKTTPEYSLAFLKNVSSLATRYGMPELLQYAFKSYQPTDEEIAQGKKPDNITVADAFQDKVENAIREATVVQAKLNAHIERQEKEERERNQNSAIRKYNDNLFDLGLGDDPQRLQKMVQLQAMWREEAETLDINPEASKYINTLVKTATERGSFAASSDDNAIVNLYAMGMKLTHNHVLAAKHKLEEKDFVRLIERAWGYEKAQMDRATAQAQAESTYMMHKALNDQQAEIEDYYTVRNPITGIIDPESAETKGKVIGMIGRWYQKNPKADAAALHNYWQTEIMKKVQQPNNPYRNNTQTPPAAPGGALPVAPRGTQAMVNSKLKTSDGQGGWH